MRKSIIKIINIIAIFIIFIGLMTTTCKARDITIITGASNGIINGAAKGFIGKVAGFIQAVAAGVATAMLFMLAIKYMTASATEKADVKQHVVMYVIGALCLYAGVAIVELIKVFMEGLG